MATTSRAWDGLVAIGRIVKPQGRHGEVAVELLSDRPDRFPTLSRAFLPAAQGGAREVAVLRAWPHKGRFVVKLQGVDSIDAAETLRGQELRIGEEELEPLPADTYYHHQLVGLRGIDARRGEVGTVSSLMETGAGAVVLVLKGTAGETLVPLAANFVAAVDLAAGVLRLTLPDEVEAGPEPGRC
ncbi:MAG: 16S rRNA processing protein RimM [Vicinamibacteria bacterium]|nr:16S rRNA processing protein RimM [Vicinamibacteria bacterium]